MTNESVFPPQFVKVFRAAQKVAVLTGAGVSAESGVPTFRDALSGLWSKFRPEELATPEAFRRNPKMVWDWYAWRRELVAKVQPNPAHHALAELEKQFPHFTLITQNVDGLHQRAGSVNLIELHGNIARTRCFLENEPVSSWTPVEEGPPRCPTCGSLLRPDVVWFGEMLPEAELEKANRAAAACDLFLSVGTSALVYPAAELPLIAQAGGACVVEINPERTPLTARVTYSFQSPAGRILPLLARLRD